MCRPQIKARLRQYQTDVEEQDSKQSTQLTGPSGEKARAKSMMQIREEKAERLRCLRHAEYEAELLGAFVRLVDYIQSESLVSICMSR